MTTTTRTVRLIRSPEPQIGLPGAFLITDRNGAEVYRFTAVAGGFQVEKFGGTEAAYTVRVGKGAGCNCKGFTNYGYCRHTGALAALRSKGKV